MGWGIQFNKDIFINKASISSLAQLENIIEEKKENIKDIETEIVILVSSNVRDLMPKEWEDDPTLYLINKMKDLFQNYKDTHIDLGNHVLLKEYILENNITDFKQLNS